MRENAADNAAIRFVMRCACRNHSAVKVSRAEKAEFDWLPSLYHQTIDIISKQLQILCIQAWNPYAFEAL